MASELKNLIGRVAGKTAPVFATKILFKRKLGYRLNLSDPRTLNEKMQYLKLTKYCHDPLVTRCVDKIEVRSFVRERIGEKYLTQLYGVWNSPEEIDFAALPERFAMKCNHASGANIICPDKSRLDREEVCSRLRHWMKTPFGSSRVELIYDAIPRRIFCEEYIETEDGLPPKDYKIFCNNGKAKFLFVATERYEGKTKFDFYDMNWQWLPVKNGHPNAAVHMEKPENLDEMVSVAEKLAEGFPLVRIDLYNEKGKILFGEMTFLHHSGLMRFDPEKWDRIFGDMIELS